MAKRYDLLIFAVFSYINVFDKELTSLDVGHDGDKCMQNNNPKSENPAMKERAAKDKDEKGRHQNDIRHRGAPTPAERSGKHGEAPESNENTKPGNLPGK
jgi:hypothetical protein